MKPVFLCGPLADPALLSVVLGEARGSALATARPARLPGHRLGWRAGARVAAPLADARAQVPGIVLKDLDLAGRRRNTWTVSNGTRRSGRMNAGR